MESAVIKVSKDGWTSYSELKLRVRETLAEGRKRAEAAVDREKVRTSWEVGKLIHEHILLNKARADYGQKVIKRLSTDLGISKRELDYSVEFARTYPIAPPAAQLSWGHYRDLLSINEEEQRKGLIGEASREKWTRVVLRREIRKRKTAKQITISQTPVAEPLIPIKGKLDTYRILLAEAGEEQGKPVIDLGFSNYFRPPAGLRFREGDIISVQPSRSVLKDATAADLFTYRAYVLDVTDGDTLGVLIDLGFGFTTRQQLRLRSLDAPELTSRDGVEAKRFAERALKKSKAITISTSKSDKYDRYLVDVFYERNGKEIFLNQELIDKGYAVRLNE